MFFILKIKFARDNSAIVENDAKPIQAAEHAHTLFSRYPLVNNQRR